MRKGQAEFIAVLGVIIIAVIAILFAFQGPSLPAPVSLEGGAVRGSLENLIRSGADETIRILSTNGGYSDPPAGVLFLNKEVPYWQRNGAITIPPVKETFAQMLEDFINENKDSFVAGLSGDITVGEASVAANFLDNKILLTVDLPTTLNGNPLPRKYDVEILTTFGEILDFAETFTEEQTKNRYLEYFILASMLASPIEDGIPVTPFLVSLTNCGEFVFRSWNDLKPQVEDRVAVTLAHTYMPEKAPYNVGETTPFPKYLIPRFNGKPYTDLDISFHLRDDFALDFQSFQFTPNPIIAIATPIPLTAVCASDQIYVQYSLSIPVIVRAKDPLTGHVFQFAHQLFIKDNEPPAWGAIYEQDIQAAICSDTQCSADIQVSSLTGPVVGAEVSFMGCFLGETDATGRLQSPIHCGLGPLEIIHPNYELFVEMQNYEEMASKQVVVPKMLDISLHFYQANVQDFASTYTVDDIQLLPPNRRVMLTLRSATDKAYIRVFDSAVGQLTQVPAGTYSVTAVLADEELQQSFGQIQTIHTFPENLESLHLYLPYNFQFSQLNSATDAEIATEKGFAFTSLLEQCGIGPIATSAVNEEAVPCSRGYDEV